MTRPSKRALEKAIDELAGSEREPLPDMTDEQAAAVESMFTTDAEGRLLFDCPEGGFEEVPI